MTTLNEKSVWAAGSCMFCTNLNVSVNVIQGNTVEVRICDSCLAEAHLTKYAPDLWESGEISSSFLHFGFILVYGLFPMPAHKQVIQPLARYGQKEGK